MRTLTRLLLVALFLALPLTAGFAKPIRAQDEGPISIAAVGLTNPRGFTWRADGTLLVAEAGVGGDATSDTDTVPPPTGPYSGGPTAAVVAGSVECPVLLASGLPSARSATAEVIGAAAVATLGDRTFVLIAGGGVAHGNPDAPAGVYELAGDGSVTLVADLSAWLRANPVAVAPVDAFDPEGLWSGMIAAPDGSALWLVESNSEQVVSVTPDGTITRLFDLSESDLAPSAIAASPDGRIYIGFLTNPPFPSGGAKIAEIDPSGAMIDVWTGLTMVTGVAIGPDGTLFATELSSSQGRIPYVTPGSGRLLRQTGPDSAAEVVTGLDQPIALAFGPDDALYVSLPATGANRATGLVIRVSPPGDGSVVHFDPRAFDLPACVNSAGTPSAGATSGPTTPITAGPDGTQSPVTAGGNAPTEIIISISDAGFDPAAITIPAGSTVMWINTGTKPHSTVAIRDGNGLWDSGELQPGATYQVTFNLAGTYDYASAPDLQFTGQIIVQ